LSQLIAWLINYIAFRTNYFQALLLHYYLKGTWQYDRWVWRYL